MFPISLPGMRVLLSAAFILGAVMPRIHADPLISEIMFHPAGVPENTGREFIEIYNPDAAPFDLTGAQIDRGVTFNFPATSIPAGGRLVIAADVAAFQARYPGVTNVIGGWTGSLSNSAEEIRIVDSTGATIDSVQYATEGDWAARVRENNFGGWDWLALADALGRSLELINPVLGNNNGQNWGPSAGNGGTPGAANSIGSDNVAPLIKNVKHRPAVPTSSDSIRISCEIEDETPAAGTATLFWRVSSANPPPFTPTPMAVNGSRFEAFLPPHANLRVIEFYVQSSDGVRTRTWPAPTNEGQNANALLQVDDEVPPALQPIHRLVMSVPEDNTFSSAGGSDRQYNVTLVSNLGSGDSVRSGSHMRVRGASSRSHNPRPMRVAIPNDNPLNGLVIFNLNPKYTYLQYLGSKLFQSAGLRAPNAKPVQVRRNGVNYARNDFFDYGRWAMVEHLDGDFVDRHWQDDSSGNLYKKIRPDNGWAYRNGNFAAYASDGFSKETNGSADDWTDLDQLMRVFNANPSGPTYLSDIAAAADVNQWMRWFALETIIANGETNVSNGTDDDYSFYRGLVSDKFELIPHDLDTILGLGDGSAITDPEHTLFDMTESGDEIEPLIPYFAKPSIRQAYFIALRDIASTTFGVGTFDSFVDNHLTGWTNAATIASIKTFQAARRAFVLQSVIPEVGPFAPAAPVTENSLSAPRTTPVVINEVLARNDSAYQTDGIFQDFIELRNYGAAPVDLSGQSLTDSTATKDKYVFPPGTSLDPGEYRILIAGNAPTGGGTATYLGFSLRQEGDGVYLYDTVANGQALVDSVEFGPQAPDFSIGRTGANGDLWQLGTPTPGAVNTTQSTGDAAQVRINEWLANPDYLRKDDFVELLNPLNTPVGIGGMILTDDLINFPTGHALPALSFIGPNGLAVLTPTGGSASPTDPSNLPFKLSSMGGWIFVRGSNGVPIDQIDMDCSFRDVSRGRSPDGAATLANFAIPTPGLPNVAPPASYLALLNQLRITEIHYNPQGGTAYEFIELKNIGSSPLTLTGVRFTEGISFTFPTATLAPGAYTVLVKDLAAFESRYGTNLPVGGVYAGTLDNSGETIALTLPPPWDINILCFRYERDWQPSTDGGGYALEILDDSVAPRDWDDADSWLAGPILHGTPGLPSPPSLTSPLAASAQVGTPFSYQITGTNSPTSFLATGLPGGLNLNASSGLISGNPTIAGEFNVTIGVTNGNGTDTGTLVLDVAPLPPPVITSPLAVNALVDNLFTYQIAATNGPTSFTATGAPAWLNFNPASGLFSGTPTTTGTFTIGIGAMNSAGTDTKMLSIQVIADEIAVAVDTNGLAFTKGGTANWFSQTANTHDGVDAAQSGDIGSNQASYIETTVIGPGTLTFWWSVSSESNFDFLRINLDGNNLAGISGSAAWRQEQFEIPAGNHTLRWVYDKDGSVSAGADAGWVDEVVLSAPDLDADGLPDEWELTYFPNLSRDGTGDFDGDGLTDAQEFMAGTIPSNPDSRLMVTAVESSDAIQFDLTWTSVPGRVYQPQASPDLHTWLDVGPVVLATAAETSTVVVRPNVASGAVVLVPEIAPVRALIPTSEIGTLWRGGNETAFTAAGGDASWLGGNTGVGYERNPGDTINYVPFIGLDVSAARNNNESVFCRIRFNVDDPDALSNLVLRMRYDDGFVAWINGAVIASRREPPNLAYNSGATGNTNDSDAITFEDFSAPLPYAYLKSGENVLAIQALNRGADSSDLLVQPKLEAQTTITFPEDRVFWRVRVVPP